MNSVANTDPTDSSVAANEPDDAITVESLIEEVSIDGMCGVY